MNKLNTILAAALLLAGCGGNEDPATSLAGGSPRGYYTGHISNDLDQTHEVSGLVSTAGQGHFRNSVTGVQYVVQLNADSASGAVSGAVRAFHPSVPVYAARLAAPGTLSATVRPRDSIAGSYSLAQDKGTFSLLYDRAIYELPSRLNDLSGVWSFSSTDEEYSVTIAVQSGGDFFGSDSEGCTYSGTFSLPDLRFNAYALETSVGCGADVQAATGLALVKPAGGSTALEATPATLVFAASNANSAWFLELNRQPSYSGVAPDGVNP